MGDEDLLEIIGNSKNVPKLQKHFKKMFAGVATVLLNTDDTCVLGICSKEGEKVSQGVCVRRGREYEGLGLAGVKVRVRRGEKVKGEGS